MTIKPSLCQRILITIIENPVGKLHIAESQKTIKSFIDSKGIRLDVYAEDAKNIYDLEMQTTNKNNLIERSNIILVYLIPKI